MKKEQEIKLIKTEDGSHTLFVPELNEPYHSVYGAIQESACVFIENGLNYFSKKEISIFEVGFGTGLNTFLTLLKAKTTHVNYRAIEAFPVDIDLAAKLNYCNQLGENDNLFMNLHSAAWNQKVKISDNFFLEKIHARLEDFIFDDCMYDLVYFDAFAPEVHEQLWQQDIFEKLARQISYHGVLVTYSTKGVVKRALRSVGFEIEKLPGPPGKREVLRAIKK